MKKMKNPKEWLYLAIVSIVMIGCSLGESEKGDLKLISSKASDCLWAKSVQVLAENNETLKINSVGDNNYKISHEYTFLNCCLNGGLSISVRQKEDSIFFIEKEEGIGLACNCICPYNLEAVAGPIKNGDYVLCIMRYGLNYKSFEVELNEQTNLSFDILQ
jgi:hypothetical protein